MRIAMAAALTAITAAWTSVSSQTLARPHPSDRPTFDVVSIKIHPEDGPVSNVVYQRPDGGFSLTALAASHLIGRAYELRFPDDVVGLPDWAKTGLYDVIATSSLSRATADERLAMWRAMLADRFGLVAHFEKRTRPAYDLVLARRDGKLGPGLTHVAVDCEAEYALREAETKAAIAAGLPWPPPQDSDRGLQRPCTLRFEPHGPSRYDLLLAGETTIAAFVPSLRARLGREVVDKTGLSGSYRVRLIYGDMVSRLRLPLPDGGPPLSSAVREQLGLRLRSSRAERNTLVVDRIERPTAN